MAAERERRRKLPAVWQLLSDNIYAHRRRKRQAEDDVMICQCEPPWRTGGAKGCGGGCINRLLAIECTPGYCPCEQHCTNQMFGRRQYAALQVLPAGAKGFGLFAGAHRVP